MQTMKAYYHLVKPGIMFGNAVAAIGGFFLAAQGTINVLTFLAMLTGLMFVIASGCVFNNFIDRNIDKKMARTKKRALAVGNIPTLHALVFASLLGVGGLGLLFFFTNPLTAAIALFGHVVYVVMYGIAKRRSVHGTVVGSFAGAVPPVVGYVAVTNQIDTAALLLFIILMLWQMPHFYAISMFRAKDYASAGIPVLSVVKDMHVTKIYILSYVAAFTVAAISLHMLGYVGYTYFVVMALFCVWWFAGGIRSFRKASDNAWAGKMFGLSLYGMILFSVMISVDWLLP